MSSPLCQCRQKDGWFSFTAIRDLKRTVMFFGIPNSATKINAVDVLTTIKFQTGGTSEKRRSSRHFSGSFTIGKSKICFFHVGSIFTNHSKRLGVRQGFLRKEKIHP